MSGPPSSPSSSSSSSSSQADAAAGADAEPQSESGGAPSVWWTPRAVGLHVTLLVVVPAFAALCWWQVRRATSGNELSWAYVFEWPFFALYAIYMWWRLVHEPTADGPPASAAGTENPSSGGADPDADFDAVRKGQEDDAELAAYNRYLAELHKSGRPKRW